MPKLSANITAPNTRKSGPVWARVAKFAITRILMITPAITVQPGEFRERADDGVEEPAPAPERRFGLRCEGARRARRLNRHHAGADPEPHEHSHRRVRDPPAEVARRDQNERVGDDDRGAVAKLIGQGQPTELVPAR